MPSNAIIVDAMRVFLPEAAVAVGITATNYLDDGEPRFAAKGKIKKLTHLVLHETCGNSAAGAKRTFSAGKFAAQLILSEAGALSCHADLATDLLWHGNQLNGCAVGLEVVNPYRPEVAKAPFGPTIPAEWWTWVPKGQARAYVLPMPIQVEAVKILVPWLCEVLGIPYQFPTAGLNAKKQQITGCRKPPLGWSAKPEPGVVCHRDYGPHSDARYLLEQVMGAR